ncbi:UNVERIFIED_CONTAM: hypothetical protein FKN15_000816 [Acipenser sinensis]
MKLQPCNISESGSELKGAVGKDYDLCHYVCFHHRPAFEEAAKKNRYKMESNDFDRRKMQAWDADEVQALD